MEKMTINIYHTKDNKPKIDFIRELIFTFIEKGIYKIEEV